MPAINFSTNHRLLYSQNGLKCRNSIRPWEDGTFALQTHTGQVENSILGFLPVLFLNDLALQKSRLRRRFPNAERVLGKIGCLVS